MLFSLNFALTLLPLYSAHEVNEPRHCFREDDKTKTSMQGLRWEKLERALANLFSSGTAFGIRIQRGAAQHVHLLCPKVVVARAKATRADEDQTSSTGKQKSTSAA